MGIATGYISLVCLILILLRIINKKSKFKKLNKLLLIIHKPLSFIFLGCVIIHLCLIIPVLKMRSLGVLITGFTSIAILLLILILSFTMKKSKKRILIHHLLSLSIAIITVLHIVTYYIDFNNYQTNINSIEIDGIDASKIPDGDYEGEYSAGYIYAKVIVTVKDGLIANINLVEHYTERGNKAEVITDDIIKNQSTNVDDIAGATNSSKVIKKACENALSLAN